MVFLIHFNLVLHRQKLGWYKSNVELSTLSSSQPQTGITQSIEGTQLPLYQFTYSFENQPSFQVCFTSIFNIVSKRNSLTMKMLVIKSPYGDIQKLPIHLSYLQGLFNFFLFKTNLFILFIWEIGLHIFPCANCTHNRSS